MYQVLTWLKLPSLNFYIPKLALKFIEKMQNVSHLNGGKKKKKWLVISNVIA